MTSDWEPHVTPGLVCEECGIKFTGVPPVFTPGGDAVWCGIPCAAASLNAPRNTSGRAQEGYSEVLVVDGAFLPPGEA